MSDKENIERRRAALSAAQRALLDQRLKGKMPGGEETPVIPRRSDPGPVLLSFPQQRLWFLDQLMPSNSFYNEQIVLPIYFPVNAAILERAIQAIVQRHEILRTTFVKSGGEPEQAIHPILPIPLTVVDLQKLPEDQRQVEAQKMIAEEVSKPFDLTLGPLLRSLLLRLAEAEYILVITLHHIIFDGWSIGVFNDELTQLYNAFNNGQPSPLPEMPIQYADYAVWQRQWLKGSILEDHLAYWKKQLVDLPVLQLPTDYPRPPIPTFKGTQQILTLPQSLKQALKSFSQARHATMFMTLLAAFAVLLHRYTDQDDLVVGMPVANRHRARELEALIGFFVNTVVLRIKVDQNPTFIELLDKVREMTIKALDHQDLPFEILVGELQPERDLSRNPLCQVAFQLINLPSGQPGYTHPTGLPFNTTSGTAKFDLRMDIGESADGLMVRLEYSTDLFRPETIIRMLAHFQNIIQAVMENPYCRVSEMPMLSPAERKQLIVDWNRTEASFPDGTCIHTIFEEHARQRPDAAAVVFEGEKMTYGELNRRANQVAHFLRSLGVRDETLVGLCMDRSFDMIIGLLGILKAGGAYVPLDPAYPAERLAWILNDAQVQVLLTQPDFVPTLPAQSARVVPLADEWEQIGRFSEANPVAGVRPDQLAYVIYTSGSTGKPKGTLLEHRGLLNVAEVERKAFNIHADTRVLQFSSLTFDASVFEYLMAFYNGAALYMGRKENLLPGQPLARFLKDFQINVVMFPPSALEALPVGNYPDLLTITVGGEACPAHLVANWAPGRNFYNLYGPTEATIWSTYAACRVGDPRPLIGRPIANTQVYVLDKYLNPVPVGVTGTLYIAGVGLGRGYLNLPELTASKFIHNPFDPEPGARMYDTGDLVRYLPDGNLDFLGRSDFQVKVRGFRIELGEIEVLLSHHEKVREAVVLAHELSPGNKSLIAYIVPREETNLTSDDLRSYLHEHLPDYMVPARFLFIDKLPLTTSGKINRGALPVPQSTASEYDKVPALPRTEVEQIVATIWQELLTLDEVGLDDNFFDLGGHSLLLARLHSRLSEAFQTEFPMIELFRYPTVRLFTQRLRLETPKPSLDQGIQDRLEKQRQARQRRRAHSQAP